MPPARPQDDLPAGRRASEDGEDGKAAAARGLFRVVLVAALAGSLVGLVGSSFAWLLDAAHTAWLERLRAWHGSLPIGGGFLAMGLGGLLVASACGLVRLAPLAGGSGIQHVEAVMRGEAEPAPLLVLPVKFVGGLLAMMPGLALGREGPTVQMAAVIGTACGKLARLGREDRFLLYTAVAGAGLAVAFNAPVAGVAFVFEEVARRFTLRRVCVTLTAIACGIAVHRAGFGDAIELPTVVAPVADPATLAALIALGALLGLAGAAYNRSLIRGADALAAIRGLPPLARAFLIGAVFGLLAWFVPDWVGGGQAQVIRILNQPVGLADLAILLAVRWLLGPLAYAAGTPGGLFAPLLLLGAAGGALFAGLTSTLLGLSIDAGAGAMVGMAALFVGVVRAPFTGILLVAEMTASVALMIPLLLASVAAALAATAVGSEPIYDTLRRRLRDDGR